MSYSLNQIETANGYTEANTLQCQGSIKLNIQVFNKGVYYSYMPWDPQHPGAGFWNPETYLAPATYLFARRAQQVRFRSAVAGEPAVVTVEALTPSD